MMLKAVLALATLMVSAGGYAVFNGAGMILNERGWSQVIAGSVVLSSGLLIVALAGLLAHFKAVFAQTGQAVEPSAEPRNEVAASVLPLVPGLAHDIHGGPSLPDHAASQGHEAEITHALAPTVPHEPIKQTVPDYVPREFSAQPEAQQTAYVAPPEPIAAFAETFEQWAPTSDSAYRPARYQDRTAEPNPHDLLTDLVPPPVPMPVARPDEWSQPDYAAPAPPVQGSLLDHINRGFAPAATQTGPAYDPYEPLRPTMPPAHLVERELVASYTAGGVGYFMYSDQTIEAEMAIGRYRFASMDELRHFVETNEGGVKVGESTQI